MNVPQAGRSPAEARVWEALEGVLDPELPVVNVVEMGIVRDVKVQGERAEVAMTPTFSGCPALHVIREDIERAVRGAGLTPDVKTVLSPPWTTDWITEDARVKLEQYGIAPPGQNADGGLLTLQVAAPRCPRCASFDTTVKNTFGPTLCKSMHVCNVCREPFEAFKTL